MDLSEILVMQKELDDRIETMHAVPKEELFEKKTLALLVELGELANETRCFKFWSLKSASPKPRILDEFADGLHFVLSLYLVCYSEINLAVSPLFSENDATGQFLQVYRLVAKLHEDTSEQAFHQLIGSYLQLGHVLGLTEDEILNAYRAKNSLNHKRQDTGY